MKRIVILIDGTWNDEGHGNDTNIAKLDPAYAGAGAPLISAQSADDVAQMAFYHKGVGAEPDLLKHLLGGAIGLGLKQIIEDAYQTLVKNYQPGDEIYITGFSRGAYAARALAGLVGASGIQRRPSISPISAGRRRRHKQDQAWQCWCRCHGPRRSMFRRSRSRCVSSLLLRRRDKQAGAR